MQNQNSGQIEHPEASGAQIMGILSIVFGCGIIGLILGIISRKKADKAMLDASSNPGKYTEASISKLKTGKTCGTIGMIMGIVATVGGILYFIFVVALVGAGAAGGLN